MAHRPESLAPPRARSTPAPKVVGHLEKSHRPPRQISARRPTTLRSLGPPTAPARAPFVLKELDVLDPPPCSLRQSWDRAQRSVFPGSSSCGSLHVPLGEVTSWKNAPWGRVDVCQEQVVEGRLGSLGGLDTAASTAGPSGADMHSKEGNRSGGSGGQDVSSWHHLIRKPQLDSMPWKRSRHNMSSDGQALTEKIIDHGSVKIIDHGSLKANVSSAEYDKEKSHEDTSKMAPSVNAQKLDANQLAAKILRLRMKGKHEEADQLSRKMEAVLEDGDISVDEPRHEKGRISIRHTIKLISAERKKGEEDADLHAANKIIHSKHYNVSRSIEDEYELGDAPRRKSESAHEEKESTHGHILTQKERCLYCFENPSRPKHLVVALGNFTYLMLPQFEPIVPGHCVILFEEPAGALPFH